jgi:hypothetical protein
VKPDGGSLAASGIPSTGIEGLPCALGRMGVAEVLPIRWLQLFCLHQEIEALRVKRLPVRVVCRHFVIHHIFLLQQRR